MTVTEAIDAIRKEGTIESDGERIKLRIAVSAKAELEPAIEAIRREKQVALELLRPAAPSFAVAEDDACDLGTILRGHALELWADSAGGQLFIVADEADAARLRERRGAVLTVAELERVVRIEDPAMAAEVIRWKRGFDAVLSKVERVPKPHAGEIGGQS